MAITVPIISEWNKKALEDAQKDITTFGDKSSKALKGVADAGKKIAAALTATAVAAVALGKQAVDAASDLSEEQSKANVIFGDGSTAIEDFASTAARSLGQSRTEVLKGANTFATFGKAAGLSGEDLVSFSTDFVSLASDLASFNNTTPEEAITAIGAALRGEAEPMRAFGVLLDDATLKAAAMELGIYDGTGALTQQQKVLAAQVAIFQQTTDAQGDFARTSDGLANSNRILSAEFENLQARIGEELLPIALSLSGWMLDTLIPALENAYNTILPAFQDAWQSLSDTLGPLIETLRDSLQPVFESIVNFLSEHTDLVKTFFAVLAGAAVIAMIVALGAAIAGLLNPFALIAVAIAGLAAGLQYAWQESETFRDIVTGVLSALQTAFDIWWGTVKWVFDNVIGGMDTIKLAVAIFQIAFTTAWELIKGIVESVYDAIASVIDLAQSAVDAVKGIGSTVSNLPGAGAVSAAGSFIGSLWPFADGGIVTGPTPALIGEAGPEAVIPLDQLGRFGGMNVTINMPAGSDGAEVVRVLEREARLRGSLPVRTAAGIKL